MKCNNCNNQIPNNSVICPHCSAPTGINQDALEKSVCPFCGAAFKSGDVFCLNCGNRLASPELVERYPITPEVREVKKKKGNGLLIALIIILSVIIIGLAAFIIIQNYNSADESTPAPSPEIEEEEKENIIELQVDAYDSEVSSDYYTIYGTASATELNSELTVNGERVTTIIAGEGTFRWSKNLYLYQGTNTFTVKLSDPEGTSTTETVTITKKVKKDSYLFESDKYYISDYDLYGKTKDEVALIRNEIYARHGYIFSTPEYAEYFSQKSWYTPNPNFSEALFNNIEKANKEFLVQYEIDRGWR